METRKIVAPALVALLAAAALSTGCGAPAAAPPAAAKYPTKPITMIVPYPAGGTADMMARAMEKLAKQYLGQQLVITNIPGGAATNGWNELAGAKADGYTIGYVGNGIILQPLYSQTRYHYPTALEPLAQAGSIPVAIVALADQPWKSVDELVKYAKEHPGEIKFGHSGIGSGNHIAGEMFAKEAGVNIAQVPFRGEAEALAALLGRHIQLMVTSLPAVKDHMKTGKVRVLAQTGEKRLTDPDFKDVPTFKEHGLNVVMNIWHGLGAPKGLPEDVKARLVEGFKGIMNDPEFKKTMDAMSMGVEYQGPKEFAGTWTADAARLTKIVQETGIAERIASQKN